jgi:hypothetical protein
MDHLKYKDNNDTGDEHFFKNIQDDCIPYILNNDFDCIPYTLDNDPDFINKDNINNKYTIMRYGVTIRMIMEPGYSFRNGYVRFSLTSDDLSVIEEISNIKITLVQEYSYIFVINLRYNLLLMKHYGYELEIKVDDENGYYLDIPLLEEFYNYGRDVSCICKLSYNIYFVSTSIYIKFSNTTIKFKQIIECDADKIVFSGLDGKVLTMTTTDVPYNIVFDNINNILLKINTYIIGNCKFIFIFIEKNSDISPQINEIIIYSDKLPPINISLDNVIQYDFTNNLVYGISTNDKCDMHNFTNMCKDPNNGYFTHSLISDIYIKFNNIIEFNRINLLCVSQLAPHWEQDIGSDIGSDIDSDID